MTSTDKAMVLAIWAVCVEACGDYGVARVTETECVCRETTPIAVESSNVP